MEPAPILPILSLAFAMTNATAIHINSFLFKKKVLNDLDEIEDALREIQDLLEHLEKQITKDNYMSPIRTAFLNIDKVYGYTQFQDWLKEDSDHPHPKEYNGEGVENIVSNIYGNWQTLRDAALAKNGYQYFWLKLIIDTLDKKLPASKVELLYNYFAYRMIAPQMRAFALMASVGSQMKHIKIAELKREMTASLEAQGNKCQELMKKHIFGDSDNYYWGPKLEHLHTVDTGHGYNIGICPMTEEKVVTGLRMITDDRGKICMKLFQGAYKHSTGSAQQYNINNDYFYVLKNTTGRSGHVYVNTRAIEAPKDYVVVNLCIEVYDQCTWEDGHGGEIKFQGFGFHIQCARLTDTGIDWNDRKWVAQDSSDWVTSGNYNRNSAVLPTPKSPYAPCNEIFSPCQPAWDTDYAPEKRHSNLITGLQVHHQGGTTCSVWLKSDIHKNSFIAPVPH